MAERLKNTLAFTLAPGASAVLPHGLQTSQGVALEPDVIYLPSPDLSVTSNATAITLTNGGAALSGAVLVEAWHTIERAFGDVDDQNLPVKPYVVVSAEGGNEPPQPAFPVIAPPGDWIQTTYYVRLTGSDTTGDGSLANPFRTYQHARRMVPKFIDMGYGYVIDCTDIGVETLPQDYTEPCTQGCPGAWIDPTPAVPYFQYFAPIICRAIPKLVDVAAVARVTAGTVAAVAGSPGLCKVTIGVARAAWAADAMKGKWVIKTLSGALTPCMIYGSTTTELLLCNTAANFNGGVGALVLQPGETLDIVEPSATLEAPPSPLRGPAIDCGGVEVGCVYQGIRTRATVAGQGFGQAAAKCLNINFELCDLVEPAFASVGAGFPGALLLATQVSSAIYSSMSDLTVQRSYWNVPGMLYLTGEIDAFESTVFEGCAPVGDNFDKSAPMSLDFLSCWFIDSTGNAISLTAPSKLNMDTCQIDGATGDAIGLSGPVFAVLNGVTGTGSTGVGVRLANGAQAQVDAVTNSASGVKGANAYVNGGEGAVAAWPAAGAFNDIDAAGQFTRIFEPA